MKLCACGCGRPTRPAIKTSKAFGWIKGKPLEFIHGHNSRKSLLERFWSRVNKTTSCWVWTGATTGKVGHGVICTKRDRLAGINELMLCHRLSWELANGPIPNGKHVLHHCDNPPCVNPKHLFLGTQADNNRDMFSKGRGNPRGMKSANRNRKSSRIRSAKFA